MTAAAQPPIRNRARKTHLFYVLCALFGVLIALAGIKITFVVEGTWGHDAFIRWGGLTVNTLGLFGFFVSESLQFLRKRRFWVLTAVLLAVHLAIFAIVLTHVEEWKLLWFMVIIIEYPFFVFLRARFVEPALK
ncbi:MAG: hypothetical protein ACYCOR_17315 [Acidobacteriaceae bacterium]